MSKGKELATTEPKTPAELALIKAVEQAVTAGNLALLNPEQRLYYYNKTCESLGLNPLTRPFDFITLNGKLVLYAKKDATDQLRKIHTVSIYRIDREIVGQSGNEQLIVTAHARDKDGKEDCDVGAVLLPTSGEARANAIMKGITKAKRRVTLSICGMGMLDENELDTIPEAREQVRSAQQSENQAANLKERFAVAAQPHAEAPAQPVAATPAPIEPEVLPKAEKPAKAARAKPVAEKKAPEPTPATPPKAPPAAVPPAAPPQAPEGSLGDTVVFTGPFTGKRLDELEDGQLRELLAWAKDGAEVQGWTGPRFLSFKKQLDEYAATLDNMVAPAKDDMQHAGEDEVDPGKALMDLSYDEPSDEQLKPDFKKIAFDRLRSAKDKAALMVAWTALFADAKDPNKINVGGMPTEQSVAFNREAMALRDECKEKLGIKVTAPAVAKA